MSSKERKRKRIQKENNDDENSRKRARQSTIENSISEGECSCKDPVEHAEGLEQSPIDIELDGVTYDPKLGVKPLVIDYLPEKNLEIINVGSTIRIKIKEASTISEGPLQYKYRLAQFHYHWGSTDECGSEHSLNGHRFSAELHLVHWNQDRYGSFNEAVEKHDGLSVLAIFFNVGKEHPEFKVITDHLNMIKYKNSVVHLEHEFNPLCLLPKNTSSYWTYHGSLTTPPYSESIAWIVFYEAVDISEDQLNALRELCSGESEGKHILDNFRPQHPLGSRKIRSSVN